MDIPLVEKQQLNLSWLDINVTVYDRNQKRYKKLLDNCTGYVSQGQTLAIMGPSGSGKTTLLNILAKRITQNRQTNVQGQTFINNNTYTSSDFSNMAAFILQDDILMETLTVRETIQFAAQFKLSNKQENIQQRIDEIIQKLNLEDCQNTQVGGLYVKGISGGEKKRTNIGVELVTNPQLIVLDEPTSGLDSYTAMKLITLLKNLSLQEGKTIIFTIHQPNSEIYQQLDRLILLREGNTVYQGKANEIVQYIESHNIEFPKFCNPADFFMYILNSKDPKNEVLTKDNYKSSLEAKIQKEIVNFCNEKQDKFVQNKKANSFLFETQIIAKRAFINFKRSPMLFRSKLIQLFVLCFLVSSLWWFIGKDQPNIDTKDQGSVIKWVTNVAGLLFFISMGIFQNVMMTYVLLFPSERNLFLKEENTNTYRVSSYFFGKLIVEIPYVIMYPILFNSVIYWLTAQRTEGFGASCLILVVLSLTGNGLGLMTGSMFSNPATAAALSPMLLLPFVLFAGFYSNLNKLPSWITWLQYISPFKYSLNALLINQFDGLIFEGMNNYDPIKTFGYNLTMWEALGILIALAFSLNALALVFLKLRTQKLN